MMDFFLLAYHLGCFWLDQLDITGGLWLKSCRRNPQQPRSQAGTEISIDVLLLHHEEVKNLPWTKHEQTTSRRYSLRLVMSLVCRRQTVEIPGLFMLSNIAWVNSRNSHHGKAPTRTIDLYSGAMRLILIRRTDILLERLGSGNTNIRKPHA